MNATEQEYQRIQERLKTLTKEKEVVEEAIRLLQSEMVSATKQYGIEATTNLQVIITDRLSYLSSLKERLAGEKRNAKKREVLKERCMRELRRTKQLYADWEQISTEHLLGHASSLFVRISIGDKYSINTTLAPLICDYLS